MKLSTDTQQHEKVSIEVRDGVAKVRTGARVLEEKAGVTRVHALDVERADITFEDGTVWHAQKLRGGCRSCGG